MVPSVESVAEVPGQPSVKQVALTIAFNDAAGPMHVISFSVRVQGSRAIRSSPSTIAPSSRRGAVPRRSWNKLGAAFSRAGPALKGRRSRNRHTVAARHAMARMPPPMPPSVRYTLAIASLLAIAAGAAVWITHAQRVW